MTEKRFKWDVCSYDPMFYDNGGVIDYDDVVDILNQLNDENEQLKKENKELKEQIEELYESDRALRKMMNNMTCNGNGICVPRRLFEEILTVLKDVEHTDLIDDLSKESIDTSINGC